MSDRYFDKFPLIKYNGYTVRDITARVVVNSEVRKNPYLYYPYDLKDNERPDQLAEDMYNDPYMSWLIYMANGITDPYYDWLMEDSVFNEYLVKKYGNIETIQTKVLHYRNNWYSNTDRIAVSQYDDLPNIVKTNSTGNTYVDSVKKYFTPVLGAGNSIIGYKRKEIDTIISTNRIVRYSISGNSSFVSTERVKIALSYKDGSDNYTYSTSGRGQVLTSNSSTVTVHHVSGVVREAPDNNTIDLTVASNNYIYGLESFSNCTIVPSSSIVAIANNVSSEDAIYWDPVTIYEHEFENNIKNKTINLVDPSIATDAAYQLDVLLGK
jgi:hypothetical protein